MVAATLSEMGFPEVEYDVSEPPRKEFGELTCNVAFQLAKHAKKAPARLAEELAEKMQARLGDSKGYIQSVEPHPAGYVNFKANHAMLSTETLGLVLRDPSRYGYQEPGEGLHIVIEHTSVNPNKALHVGHIRNVIIGDALFRLLRAINHSVTVLNYVDDSGLQVADIVIAFKFAGFSTEPPEGKKFDQYCGDDVYVKINEMYEKDPVLAEKRKVVLQEMEQGRGEIALLASQITGRVLAEQLKTCWRMKARYDLLNFESQIVVSKLWSESFELLKNHNIARFETEGKNKGCWVIAAQGEEDKVIVRSDGTATYVAKDIPYAAWKLGLVNDPFSYKKFADQWDGSTLYSTALDGKKEEWSFSGGQRVITVIDSRQARLQRIVSQVLSKIVTDSGGREYHHLGYEAVTISAETAKALGIDIGDRDFMHMSGRKGIYVSADYVMDTLHSRAYTEVKIRNPDFDEPALHRIAEEIAISALRYNMIRQDLDKIITFDIKESLSLEGDTGPYLQYAYARSQRILEKSGQDVQQASYEKLSQEAELALIKEISKLDLVIEDAANSLSPKTLARYAYFLATTFNLFYEKVPVLKEQDTATRTARLALVKAFGFTLKNALDILGITALDRM